MNLAGDLARALNPVLVANDLGMVPDPWQESLLRSKHKRILLNIHRQGGKSTTVAIIATHRARYVPGSLVLVISKAERQAKLLFKKIKANLRRLGVVLVSESATEMVLPNGSEIVCVPGNADTVRGYSSVDLLLIDEASRVPDDVMGAVSPMVAISDGTIIACSTPYGKRGWWSESWHDHGQDWERVRVPVQECPRLMNRPRFLHQELMRLGPHFYAQEYECTFASTTSALLTIELIDSLFTPNFSAHRD